MQNELRPKHNAWDDARVKDALILLQSQTAKEVAESLGVTAGSLYKALRRRNVSVQQTRKRVRLRYRKTRQRTVTTARVPIWDYDTSIRNFADRKDSACSWPIGEPGAELFRFCNAPRIKKSYCLHHARVAYQAEAA